MSSFSILIAIVLVLNGCTNKQEQELLLGGKRSIENDVTTGCRDRQKIILKKYDDKFDGDLNSVLEFLLSNKSLREELSLCSK